MKITRFVFTLFAVVIGNTLLATSHVHAAAPIDAGYNSRMIDDSLFLNTGTMSAQSIQAFLNSKVPVCDSFHVDTNGNRPSQPWICLKDYIDPTTGKSSAQLIYDEAQSRGINPQVILVTLQKEQSLITDTWPFPSQYKSAMGYGCPESQSVCDSQYFGFYNQVHLGSTLLRAGVARDCGDTATFSNWYINPQWRLGNTVNVDGRPTYMGTCATGALYNYTPHRPDSAYTPVNGTYYFGNYNFVNFFSNWFGPTSNTNLPVGINLVSSASTGKIYMVNGSNYYYIPSWDILIAYRLSGSSISTVDDSFFNGLTSQGSLATTFADSSSIYLANNGSKYRVPSSTSCTDWGLTCFDPQVTKTLDPSVTNWLASAGDLPPIMVYRNVAYKLSGGSKLPFATVQDISNAGYSLNQAILVQDINGPQPLGQLILTIPTLIKFAPDNRILLFDGAAFYLVPDIETLVAWGQQVMQPVASSYNATPPAASTSLKVWQTDGTRFYLVDGGRKIDYSSQKAQWPNVTSQALSPSALSILSGTSVNGPGIAVGPSIYVVSAGTKHRIIAYEDIVRLGVNLSSIVALTSSGGGLIPDGPVALPDGTTYGLTGNPKLFVVNGAVSLHIPSISTFNDYGLNGGNVRKLTPDLATGYPESGTLPTLVKGVYGHNFFVIKRNRYLVDAQDTSTWGIPESSFTTVANESLLAPLTIRRLGSMIQNLDDGRIYFGSGGAKHYVQSYDAFLAHGGYGAMTEATSALVDQMPTGTPLP